MNANAAGLVLQEESRVDEFAGHLFLVVSLLELGVLLERVLQAPFHVGDHLGQSVRITDRQSHNTAHIANDRLRAHGAEGDDLSDGIPAVLVPDVADYLSAAVVGKVDVNVGRADTFWIEESLEEQPIAQRVDVPDLQQVGDHGAGG